MILQAEKFARKPDFSCIALLRDYSRNVGEESKFFVEFDQGRHEFVHFGIGGYGFVAGILECPEMVIVAWSKKPLSQVWTPTANFS